MKFNSIVILAFAASATFVRAQDQQTDALTSSPFTARILGKIPDGTPPPPAPPQRKLVIPAEDVLETKVHQQGGRTVTIRKIKPLPLPPPPAPVPEPDPATVAEFRRLAAEYRETHRGTELLFLGATVFRSPMPRPDPSSVGGRKMAATRSPSGRPRTSDSSLAVSIRSSMELAKPMLFSWVGEISTSIA